MKEETKEKLKLLFLPMLILIVIVIYLLEYFNLIERAWLDEKQDD